MTPDNLSVEAYHRFNELERLNLPHWDPAGDNQRYQLVKTRGCILIFGSLPMSDFPKLLDGAPANAVLDTNVARMAGATFASGAPADLERLAGRLGDAALLRTRAQYQDTHLSEAAMVWLALGRQGSSSLALFFHLSGVASREHHHSNATGHPHDASDLGRCRRMLEEVPDLNAKFLAAPCELSSEWKRIWISWNTLCATMDAEAPDWRTRGGRGTQTTDLLRSLVDAT